MPDLKDLIKERNVKKFTKKNYRPWDLSGSTPALINESEINQPITHSTAIESKDDAIISAISLSEKNDSIIDTELDTNKISNRYQSDSDLENNQISNEYQMDNKKESLGYQLGINSDSNKISAQEGKQVKKISSKNTSYLDNNQNTAKHFQQAFEETDESMLEQEIIRLSGKQKIIFDMLIEICTTRNCTTTGPIQTASLANFAQTTIGTIKTILKRLIDKQLIIRHQGKNAKGGYINLGVTSTVLELIKNLKNNSRTHLFAGDIIMAYRYQKDISQDTNSSISINNITTTNTNKRNEQIPQEWEQVNFDPLSHIGFTKTQILQLIGKNEPTIVQESIHHFAYGFEHNQKVKKYEEPLNVLMGVLRKGQGWVEPDYRSAIEIAQEKLLEAKKSEIARKKSLEEEAFKLAFDEWAEKITDDERQKITDRKKGDLTPTGAKLTMHFREHIWNSVKANYVLF